MVRRSGFTTRELRDAISKWQTVEQGLMAFFGQEILIAPAAIQADVEVSQMFSCYHQMIWNCWDCRLEFLVERWKVTNKMKRGDTETLFSLKLWKVISPMDFCSWTLAVGRQHLVRFSRLTWVAGSCFTCPISSFEDDLLIRQTLLFNLIIYLMFMKLGPSFLLAWSKSTCCWWKLIAINIQREITEKI